MVPAAMKRPALALTLLGLLALGPLARPAYAQPVPAAPARPVTYTHLRAHET